jgi:hypothetical protein
MPVVQTLSPIDQLFYETENKIIINDLKLHDADTLRNALYVQYQDKIDMVPSCTCGYLKGAYLKGEICNRCGTPVTDKFTEVKPLVWIRKFREDLKFLSPYMWAFINNILGKADSLRWLADTTYNPGEQQSFLYTIKDFMGGRGYRNLIRNLIPILELVKGFSKFKKPEKQRDLDIAINLLKEHPEACFSNYIPMLNRNLFVKEISNKDVYTSAILGDVLDTSMLVLNTLNRPNVTEKRLEILTAKVIAKMAELFNKYARENLAGKTKLIRKHIYGTRAHFTSRAVITAITGKHHYQELHLPWVIAIPLFRPHILNKLVKRGYSYREASDKIFAASTTIDDEIYEILNELIKESPHMGIPVLFHRNPTLLQGSSQLYYITKIKKDYEDRTISLSTLTIKAPNGDYDGDAMNLILLIDEKMHQNALTLAPKYNIVSLEYFEINGYLYIPSTVMPNIANYIKNNEDMSGNDEPVLNKLMEISSKI